jgi:hypothetical protein
LQNGQPVPYPKICDGVFAVIDTASKTGTDNDATAVTYFAIDRVAPGNFPLIVLDWDIAQIEGATLEIWLPSVFDRLEELARQCRARFGSVGAFIEDKNSGTILLQQSHRRGMQAQAIDSKLTAMGKDERAINVSSYVHQVIALTGDGGFNMLMGEFMTAVHHKLPVKVVIYNNSRLGLIFLEAEGVGLPAFREAIEFPNPDFVALARACGAHGFKAAHPDELHGAIAEALAVDGPAIVDCVVVADELPNMPHIDLGLAKNYAIAKIKEAVIAATGR